MAMADAVDEDLAGLLARDEWPLRWQRKFHLVPNNGMGLGRRAVFFAMLAWLPLAVWAVVQRHAFPDAGSGTEALLGHFGINVRCLIAIPLLILAEGSVTRVTVSMVKQFLANGLVTEAQRGLFATRLRNVARLRDSSLPWVMVAGIAIAWLLVDPADPARDELSWALDSSGGLAFGGWWFAYVARPIFLALVLSWLWRIVVVVVLFQRISTLDLALVPTHPDRAGGLGFLESYPGAFALVTLAVSAVIASGWAHDVVYHGDKVETLIQPLAVFAVAWSLLVLAPLLIFVPKLMAAKGQAKIEYGRLLGEQGRNVRKRWIVGEAVSQEMLEPGGVGPIADAISLYGAVLAMRAAPIGKIALIAVLLPLAVPMLVVFSLEIPIKTLLMNLLKVLV